MLESRAQVLPRASSRQQYDELCVVDKARAPMLVFFLCFERESRVCMTSLLFLFSLGYLAIGLQSHLTLKWVRKTELAST